MMNTDYFDCSICRDAEEPQSASFDCNVCRNAKCDQCVDESGKCVPCP